MEGQSWRIERIWSTSWFNDSSTEIKIIVDKIEEIRKKDKRSPYVEIQTEEAALIEEEEEDEITQIEEEVPLEEEEDEITPLEEIQEQDEIPKEEYEEEEEELAGDLLLRMMDEAYVDEPYEIEEEEEEEEEEFNTEEQIINELMNLRPYIESDFPNTEPDKRLLTDGMINALSSSKPTSYEEFRSEIPFGVRRSVNGEEAQSYLWEVLEIIEQIK